MSGLSEQRKLFMQKCGLGLFCSDSAEPNTIIKSNPSDSDHHENKLPRTDSHFEYYLYNKSKIKQNTEITVNWKDCKDSSINNQHGSGCSSNGNNIGNNDNDSLNYSSSDSKNNNNNGSSSSTTSNNLLPETPPATDGKNTCYHYFLTLCT